MPVITVSRQFGSGGHTLAQVVAEKLGYKFVYEEIIDSMAEQAKISTESIKAFESEGIDGLKNSGRLSPKRFIDHIFDSQRKYMDGPTYVRLLNEIIPRLAEKDNTIILGRGAQFILKNRPNTLHILCVADQEDRNRFMQKRYDLSASAAADAVNRQSKRRMKLLKLFHHEDYDQPYYYDLVLNLSKLSMDQAVNLVIRLVEAKKAAA
ncbi:MAG: cytidylate kinase-like family protein [Desulfobacterales bacterium]|jgi:cytidylate kinase|nr:cytidylate kinase-like family protein [Desulfobacterales bacterium]